MKGFSFTLQATVKSCLFSQGFFLVFQFNCLSKKRVTKPFALVHIRKADSSNASKHVRVCPGVPSKPEAHVTLSDKQEAGSASPFSHLALNWWERCRLALDLRTDSKVLTRKLKGLLSWHSLFEVHLKNAPAERLKSNGYCLQPGWEFLCRCFLFFQSNRCQWWVTILGGDWATLEQ